jgi:hypothetical protein
MGRNALRGQVGLAVSSVASAECGLVVAAVVWSTSPVTRDGAPWGPDVSVAVVAIAALIVAATVVAVVSPLRSASRRRIAAFCVAVTAGAVGSMGVTGLGRAEGANLGVDLLLAVAAIPMLLLAAYIALTTPGDTGTCGRSW